jgi:hypothetical protein
MIEVWGAPVLGRFRQALLRWMTLLFGIRRASSRQPRTRFDVLVKIGEAFK